MPVALDQVSKHKNLRVVKIQTGITNNVFDFVDLIKKAKEIHVVGSFFQCIVDSMVDQTSADLYFHNIMIKHDAQINCAWNNNRWIQLEYRNKY